MTLVCFSKSCVRLIVLDPDADRGVDLSVTASHHVIVAVDNVAAGPAAEAR